MSTTFTDPVIINNTADITAAGAQTAASTAADVSNTSTSSTAGVEKIGVRVSSTGTWDGTDATNCALRVDPATGGTVNWNIYCGPPPSAFTSATEGVFAESVNVLAVKNPNNSVPPLSLINESNVDGVGTLTAHCGATDGATEIVGVLSITQNDGATLVNGATAFQAWMGQSDGSTADMAGFWLYVDSESITGGTVANRYGVRIDDLLGADNSYAIHTNQSANADSYAIYNGGDAKSYFGGEVGIGTSTPASRLDIADGAITVAEMTAPSAPAADSCVIYAEDNGSGKTRLMVRFPTGAAVQIAIEP